MIGLPATRSPKAGVTDTFTVGTTSIVVPLRIRRITTLVIVGAGGELGYEIPSSTFAGGGGGGEVKRYTGTGLAVSPGDALTCEIGEVNQDAALSDTAITINGTEYEAEGGKPGSANSPQSGGDGGYGGAGGAVSLAGHRGVGSVHPVAATSGTSVTSGSWTSYPGGGGGSLDTKASGNGYTTGTGGYMDAGVEEYGGGGGSWGSYGTGGGGVPVVGEQAAQSGAILVTWGS